MRNRKSNLFVRRTINRCRIKASLWFTKHAALLKAVCQIMLITAVIIAGWKYHGQLLEALKLSLKIGWFVFIIPALFLIWNLFATCAWLRIIQATSNGKKTNFWNLYLIRIQGQALNLVVPLCGLGGEALRMVKISTETGMRSGVTSVAADKTVDILAEAVLALVGGIAAARFFPYPATSFILSLVGIGLLAGLFAFWKKIGRIALKVLPFGKGRTIFYSFSNDKRIRHGIQKAFLHHFVEHILMAGEIVLIAHLLGTNLGIQEILLVNTISSLFNLMFVFIPGRLGAYECSTAWAFRLLSLQPAAGVSVALIRRARQLLVCCAGIIVMALQKGTTRHMHSVPLLNDSTESHSKS